jgi:hypothetical protein
VHGARGWSTSRGSGRGQLVLLADRAGSPVGVCWPADRRRHGDDLPERVRRGTGGGRHGGVADEASAGAGTSSSSTAPHRVRGRHPGWRPTGGDDHGQGCDTPAATTRNRGPRPAAHAATIDVDRRQEAEPAQQVKAVGTTRRRAAPTGQQITQKLRHRLDRHPRAVQDRRRQHRITGGRHPPDPRHDQPGDIRRV